MEVRANRERNAELARKNILYMKDNFEVETLKSIKETKVYAYGLEKKESKNEKSAVVVCDMTATEALYKYADGKTCILSFASFKNPGGGFVRGAMAQEESLCHNSNLYNILKEFEGSFYSENCRHLRKGMYCNRALYTPDVVYRNGNKVVRADILTCAAPNFKAASEKGVKYSENLKELRDRIKFILDILEEEGCDTVILGAFGCGVFGQNPYDVAMLFNESRVLNRGFKNVVFAVPDKTSRNHRAFKSVFERNN